MATTRAGLHPVNPILTTMVTKGLGNDFLVDMPVLPQIIVPTISGTWMRDDPTGYHGAANIAVERARGDDRAKGETNDPINGTFAMNAFAFRVDIDLELDPVIDQLGDLPVRRATQAARTIKTAAELRLQQLLFPAVATWAASTAAALTTGTIWSAVAAAPLTDLNILANTTMPNTAGAWGERPNTMVISHDVAVVLNANAEVRGYLNVGLGLPAVGVGSMVNPIGDNFLMLRSKISSITNIPIDRIFIGSAIQNTANTGQAGVQARIWTNQCWLGMCDTSGAKTASDGNRVQIAPSAAVDFSGKPFAAGSYVETQGILQWQWASQMNDYNQTDLALGRNITNCLT